MGILQKYRSNIVADFDYRKGLKADQSGLSGVPAITGSPAFTNSSEGRGIAFPNPDIASYITQAWASSNLSTNGTFYAIFVHNDPTNASVQGLLASGRVSNYNWVTRVSGGNCSLRLHDTTFTDTQDLISGKTYIAIWTVDATTLATTAVKSWVNGNRGLSTTGNLTKNLDGSLGDFIEIGRYAAGGSAAMFNGIIFKCGALNVTLTEQEAAELTKDLMDEAYVTKAFTERLKKTDGNSYAAYVSDGSGWNETLANVTAGPLDGVGGGVISGSVKVSQFDRIKKQIEANSLSFFVIPTEVAYGTWEWDWQKASGKYDSVVFIASSYQERDGSSQTGYEIANRTNSDITVAMRTNGVSSAAYFTANVDEVPKGEYFRIRITRSTAGVFTMYKSIDGGAFTKMTVASGSNPFTENTVKTSSYASFRGNAGSKFKNISYIEEGY